MYREQWRISSLLLFFYGHLVAGLAGYETIILFIIGVGLSLRNFSYQVALQELIGSLAIIGSIIMAGGNPMYMAYFCPYRDCYRCHRDGDYYEVFR